MKILKTALLFLCISGGSAQAQSRWHILPDGEIEWTVGGDIPHYDHLEMSGEAVSAVLRYGVNPDGSFSMERSMVWPMLRRVPNDTGGSLMRRFSEDFVSLLQVDAQTLDGERVKSMRLNGKLTVVSEFAIGRVRAASDGGKRPAAIEVTRVYFPSTDKPMLCEQYSVKNIGKKPVELSVPRSRTVYRTDPEKGTDGSYTLVASTVLPGEDLFQLNGGDSAVFGASIQAYKDGQTEVRPDIAAERLSREAFVDQLWRNLDFRSPDDVLNTAFAFAKIRGSESIFRTGGGLMHGPGGETYYAAIWANDQAEYINPFFPLLGYATGNESAMNSFRHFARFMNPAFQPIPSSIIAEGKNIWNGAGDRGDAAMIAYGAARYALEMGDSRLAGELWPLIAWCLDYCRGKLNEQGVVSSDTDELENRFPSGEANLCTSTLYYDALLSAAFLARDLGKPASLAARYRREAAALRRNIARYFEASVEGFETYRYYAGNDVLRSWICMPLVVNIFDRKQGTIEALLSPRMWTENGLLTQAGTTTFWDRSTLYALRGIFAAGERETALRYIHDYSVRRLLGDHVPYPIEAWPEGNQRHLSAESGLYCRIVTEGLFGIRPTGFRSFVLTPQLPDEWPFMELKNIHAFDTPPFDLRVERAAKGVRVQVVRAGKPVIVRTSKNGSAIPIRL